MLKIPYCGYSGGSFSMGFPGLCFLGSFRTSNELGKSHQIPSQIFEELFFRKSFCMRLMKAQKVSKGPTAGREARTWFFRQGPSQSRKKRWILFFLYILLLGTSFLDSEHLRLDLFWISWDGQCVKGSHPMPLGHTLGP